MTWGIGESDDWIPAKGRQLSASAALVTRFTPSVEYKSEFTATAAGCCRVVASIVQEF